MELVSQLQIEINALDDARQIDKANRVRSRCRKRQGVLEGRIEAFTEAIDRLKKLKKSLSPSSDLIRKPGSQAGAEVHVVKAGREW